jgi:branched-chain amino acid transport system substrate-binding protein
VCHELGSYHITKEDITVNKKRLVSLLLVGLLLSSLIVACGPAPTPEQVPVEVEITRIVEVESEPEVVVVTATPEPEVESETIVIGGVGPLSAPGAYQQGTEMLEAAQMAVGEVNAAGGVLGKQVELIFGDTEGLPERGTAVAERLISQNKVVGIIGEAHSGVGMTEMEVAHKYGIPIVFAETWSDEITAAGYPEVFRIAPTVEYFTNLAINYYMEVGWKKFVWILEDTEYGHTQAEAFETQLADLGIEEPPQFIYADPTTEDFTPILQRLLQDPPDLLALGIMGVANSRLVRQACELGLAPTAETALGAAIDAQYPEFWETAGDCGQYAFFTFVGLPESLWNEKTAAFMTNFEETYEHQPGGAAMEAYDATYLLLNAIEQTGSTEPQAIIEALENIEYTGVLGDVSFEYTSQNPVPDGQPAWMWHQFMTPAVFQLQYTEANQTSGEAVVVYPRERATGPLYTSP